MSLDALRIAVLGGVPPSLGGGGLELQIERTTAALSRLGHEVFDVARESRRRTFDVLHAFSSGPDVAHVLSHWRRCDDVPLVVTTVMVVPAGAAELRQRIAHRLAIPEFGPHARRLLLRRADALVAASADEARLLRDLGGRGTAPITVVPNGADPAPGGPIDLPVLPEGYVLLLGNVSARKRQADVVRCLLRAGGPPPVVIGGFHGGGAARDAFDADVRAAGGAWLGELHDPGVVRAVVRRARALVHLSAAEAQSLAVVEALAEGTPVVAATIPVNEELAAAYPTHVRLVASIDDLPKTLAALPARPVEPPLVPSWTDVATRLVGVYGVAGAAKR